MATSRETEAATTGKHSVELIGEQKGPVRLEIVRSQVELNTALVRFALDYSKAASPERAYYADYCEVVKARSGYSFFFGKLVPGSAQLRTKVEIAFPEDMFVQQLWRSSVPLRDVAKGLWEKAPLESIGQVKETEKVQTFRANNVFVAMLGEESLMDFYYLAPSEIHFVRSGQRAQVHLEPVIRITLPSAMVHEFWEKCRVFIEKIPGVDDILNMETGE